ncbi:Retrovirus-related Pol polyprotein from transposon RE2 [Cardamine amara subsp. amara]|uniref:Retrovirus-related Pol polyprotein from transposon RE2 n=1 Tax=Cardamine amara subsp. amara TaxID=228776 RepID=A0ABD1A9F0_CARAN
MDQFPKEHQAFLSEIDKHKIPKSYEEACLYDVWVQAMLEEIDSMVKNETWDEIEKPSKKKLVGCRWVYTIKYASNGEIERYKARLVAKGVDQKIMSEDQEEDRPLHQTDGIHRSVFTAGSAPVICLVE